MKWINALCLTSFLIFSLPAQGWLKVYDLGSDDQMGVQLEWIGDRYAVNVAAWDSKTGGTQHLLFLDSFGDTLKVTPLLKPDSLNISYFPLDLVHDGTGHFYTQQVGSVGGLPLDIVRKFDRDGNMLWARHYSLSDSLGRVFPAPQGLTLGVDSSYLILTGQGENTRVGVARIDTAGSLDWHSNVSIAGYGTPYGPSYFMGTTVAPDGSIKINYGSNASLQRYGRYLSVSSEGEFEYIDSLFRTPNTRGALARHPSGNILHSTWMEREDGVTDYWDPEYHNWGYVLQLLTPEFDTIWTTIVDWRIHRLVTGFPSALLVDVTQDRIYGLLAGGGTFIYCFDLAGNFLWFKEIHGDSLMEPYRDKRIGLNASEFCLAPDGGLIITGGIYVRDPEQPREQIFVIKLDTDGCIEPGCSGSIVTGTADPPLVADPPAPSWQVSPNPAQAIVRLDYRGPEPVVPALRELRLLDASGRILARYLDQPNPVLSIAALPAGVYRLLVVPERGRREVVTFVKQ